MELKAYFRVARKKMWLIALFVLIGALGSGVKSYMLTTPLYQAYAQLVVNQPVVDNQSSAINTGAVQANLMLINSYKEIIRSAAIMNQVVEKYPELEASPGQLASNIRVTSSNQSQVMNLIYTDTSYRKAAEAVNAVANVFKEQIPTIMKVDNVMILNYANVDARANPVNTNPVMNIIVSMIVALMLGLGLVYLLDYLDNTMRTEEEVMATLGLPTLMVLTRIKKKDLRQHANKQKVGETNYATIG